MKETDVVVLGGSAAGLTAAVTARRHHPDKRVLVIRREKQVPVPCGIPYVFGTLGDPAKNVMPDAPYQANRIDLLLAEVEQLNVADKTLHTSEGDVRYERLILASGSLPAMPPVPGFEKDGVFAIQKDMAYLGSLLTRLKTAENVVIIGGGFIGIEFADEIHKLGKARITVVEMMPHCLSLAYDDEFCVEMEELLTKRGIAIRTSARVESIEGQGRAEAVLLSDGSRIEADTVIVGIGAVPNVDLARKAGLRIGLTGGIAVDQTMMTSDAAVFACGDCAEKISFFGGRHSTLKLASIAQTEARIAGANLFGIKRQNNGTVGVWSTCVGDLALGTAGLTEAMARQRGYDVVTATIQGPNRHPGGMPGATQVKMKAVFERNSGVILGAQVRGDPAIGEMINAASACVQMRMTVEDIATFQIGTHPALTASPVAYPLVNLAEMAISQMRQHG
ncbi:MAG: FAD-dependent oxidoreductase [Phycisphaerae bacterium]|jgi:NADPH-dependent 2,4-dienoyl-CoA reductase/sulfur reductase-like enzyme